jgi:hypothetical protein
MKKGREERRVFIEVVVWVRKRRWKRISVSERRPCKDDVRGLQKVTDLAGAYGKTTTVSYLSVKLEGFRVRLLCFPLTVVLQFSAAPNDNDNG